MTMGYNGKVLFVDLTSGSIKEESLPEKVYRDFIGGQGLGARVLYERMKAKVDPLGEDNILGFLTGPLTGTGVTGSRLTIVGKSPVSGGWGDSSCGGSFAAELKASGYDGVFFSGVSTKPVYLFLHDGRAELKDASHLWGKETFDTAESIRSELGDKLVNVICIGPAGEAKSLLAAIMHKINAAGRSGLAAVMGAKRLKAFATRGTKKVTLADAERFTTLRKNYVDGIKSPDNPWGIAVSTFGTCYWNSSALILGDAPIKNWALAGEEKFPTHLKMSGPEIIKYQVRKRTCLGCPIACHGIVRVEKGPYAGTEGAKPEYETSIMLGSNLFNDDVEALIKANDLCNRYGLDTIGLGSSIAFAMECYERGVITKDDTDGIELAWGNSAGILAMIEKVARREGFGAILADGSKLAAKRIGKGSEKWAMEMGGQDMPAHDPRASIGYAWGYICDPTPARHTTAEVETAYFAGVPFACFTKLDLPQFDPLDMKANAPIYVTLSALDRLWTSAGMCIFALYYDPFPLAELISAATGWDFSLAEGLKAGRRIHTLRQAFNSREGLNTSEWRLPERIAAPPATGPIAGKKVDFGAMKKEGYAALGWDTKTGKPLESTLQELGLKELVGQLP